MSMTLPPEFLTAGIWLWESFSKDVISSLASSAKAKLEKQWEKVEWSLAAKRYRDKIYELYSTVRILGSPFPVRLEGIFTDIQILDKPSALRRYDIENLKTSYSTRSYIDENYKRTNALDLIQKIDRLFVLGKPGAGKTTLLKYISVLAAKGEVDKVPIFISLNDWTQNIQKEMSQYDLMAYIVRQFEICSFPDAQVFIEEVLLKKGRAIILFDGLDEVSEGHQVRDQVIRIIADFTNQYSQNKFIITCRVAAEDYYFEKYIYVEIADFTKEQINTFVYKWFGNFPEKGDRFIREIERPQNLGLYELARTPILLSLLCISFDETLVFPNRRNEIYQEAIDALLKKWDSSRNIKRNEIYQGLSPLRKRQLLSRIAAEYFQEDTYFFKTQDITKRIQDYLTMLPNVNSQPVDGETVLKAMEAQHGIIVERALNIHSFSHLSLQEYLTSQYVVEYVSEKTLKQLMFHLQNSQWREVFIMVAGALPNADSFFDAFVKKQKNLFKSVKLFNMEFLSKTMITSSQRFAFYNIAAEFDFSVKQEIENSHQIISEAILIFGKRVDFYIPVRRKISTIIKSLQRILHGVFPKDVGSLDFLIDNMANNYQELNQGNIVNAAQAIISHIYNQMYEIMNFCEDTVMRRPVKTEIALLIERHEFEEQLCTIKDNLANVIKEFEEIYQLLGLTANNANDIFDNFGHITMGDFRGYLYVNGLLLECIKVAAVSDRISLINSLFI